MVRLFSLSLKFKMATGLLLKLPRKIHLQAESELEKHLPEVGTVLQPTAIVAVNDPGGRRERRELYFAVI